MPVMEGQAMAEDLAMVEDPAMAAAPTVGMEALAMEALALGGIAAVDQAMVALAEDMEAQAEAMEVVLSLTLYRQVRA